MTLQRQLFSTVSALFLALLVGIEAVYLFGAREQLREQLAAQAHEAATSLSLRLASLGELGNDALVETAVNSLFDRGYFQEVRFLGPDGAVRAARDLPPAPPEVPAWFTRLLPIEAPEAQALVSSGWRQLGRVTVRSQPGFAYLQLWTTGLNALALLAALYLAAMAATAWFLSVLLRPLREIERAALAIGNRDFATIGAEPRARELARVVGAMNAMSGKIKQAIAEESERAEALRREAYMDPLTGVYNRRGFERQLHALEQSKGDVHSTALGLLELRGFAEYNARAGYQRADETLTAVARALRAAFVGPSRICGRMGGAGFAFAAINAERADLDRAVAGLCDHVGLALAEQAPEAGLEFHCGATRHEGAPPEFPALLAAADHAIERARERDSGAYEIEAFDQGAPGGSGAWKALLDEALERDALGLYAQEVRSLPGGATAHVEVTVRLLRPGAEPLAAGQFLPMAARHGLAGRIDARVLEKLLDYLGRAPGAPPAAVNVSARTVADGESVRRILALLDGRAALARRIVFEMTEYGALHEAAAVRAFNAELRRRGAGFALDNFGVLHDSLELVHALRPAYIKLAPAYTRELPASADSRFLVESLVRIARPLEIGVFAQAVESEDLLPLLAELRLSGYQGYAISRPAPLA